MTSQRTALRTRMSERHKARFRFALLALLTIVVPSLTGVRSTPIWVLYALFAMLYALWTLHLTARFSADYRLGYLLCLTDAAVLLPLVAWNSDAGVRVMVVLVYGAGLVVSYGIRRGQASRRPGIMAPAVGRSGRAEANGSHSPQMALEGALRSRLTGFTIDGTRFGLVVLRILRHDEAAAYYGHEAAARMVSAVGRRGLRHLGPGAELHSLGRGRVAFLFEIEDAPSRVRALSGDWNEPYDVEGMAMRLARRTCERLIEGHRAECVVGWASAPVDGLSVDDLLYVAENGTRSTEAFRRVSGAHVAVRVRPSAGPAARRVAASVPDEARTAVG